MLGVRAKMLAQTAVKRAYGDVGHALNKSGEKVAKVKFGKALKKYLFISKTVCSQNLQGRRFD